MTTAPLQFCTFQLGDLFMGVEVQKVLEIIRYQKMTPVPLSPHCVSGLINLRGQIVCAIDLRRRLGLEDFEHTHEQINVVLQRNDGPVSLLVDEVGEVMAIEDSSFERPPNTLDAEVRELLEGVYKTRDRLLLVLDTERVIQTKRS